jgi:DNA-binding transcriptional MerR regulator
MFRIGEFSKVCQVSIKALRHWDEIGLLKPAYTDPATGYRYYVIDQLRAVNRILAFRGMGLSLNQVTRLLEEDLPAHEIRGMLKLKQAEIQQQIEEGQQALKMVEARLKLIDEEGQAPDYDVIIKQISPLRVLSIRETTETMFDMVELMRETHTYTKHIGALLAVFHDEGFDNELVDIQLCLPVSEDYSGESRALAKGRAMTLASLPGVDTMASIVHKGRWLTLHEGYAHIGDWIQRHGYQIAGPGREIFHHIGWETDPDSNITEIQFPVTLPAREKNLLQLF